MSIQAPGSLCDLFISCHLLLKLVLFIKVVLRSSDGIEGKWLLRCHFSEITSVSKFASLASLIKATITWEADLVLEFLYSLG